jgi:hypothetical protein
MSKDEYKHNRDRVFEIMGISPDNPDYNCHHSKIYRREAKRDKSLRADLDKIDNLFPLRVEEHERLHKLEEGQEPLPIQRRRKRGKRNRH